MRSVHFGKTEDDRNFEQYVGEPEWTESIVSRFDEFLHESFRKLLYQLIESSSHRFTASEVCEARALLPEEDDDEDDDEQSMPVNGDSDKQNDVLPPSISKSQKNGKSDYEIQREKNIERNKAIERKLHASMVAKYGDVFDTPGQQKKKSTKGRKSEPPQRFEGHKTNS